MERYLFLSHSNQDEELTDNIISFLNGQNLNYWSPGRNLQAGSKWKDEIIEKIKNCSLFLFVITQNSIKSQWLSQEEVPLALQFQKVIIPVVDENLSFSELPEWSRDIEIVRFPSQKEKLQRSIAYYLNREPEVVPQSQPLTETEKDSDINTDIPPNQPKSSEARLPSGEDKTPFHKDSPSSIDYLGRKGFVEALAQWIDRYWTEYQTEDKSFIINIHGQWGAGKTTFLNLLQNELQNHSNNKWIVVWFNAWENRHIRPEWWPLLDRIYRDSVSQKKGNKEGVWHIKFQEWWWRFYSGRKLELLGFLASSLLFALILFWVMRPGFLSDQHFMQRIEAVAKPIGFVFSALSTIFLGTRFVSQALISSGSANAAKIYLQFTPDPIANIKAHFNDLIEKKINKPVIVFIDDLDRCDRRYLVNLLESVQTMLDHKKVFYVIAADQRWLFAAFEKTYDEFKESIKEPGKKIGYLFLEKIFQLSMSIPNISDETRVVYLDYLLGNKKQIEAKRAKIEEKRKVFEKDLAGIKNEQGLINKVQSQKPGTIDKVLMREVAVAKSASLEIEKETVHFLSCFAHLMEPNPRAIKRLVTYYGVLRAIAILCDEEIISDLNKRNQLALWTITKMRWPLLADYLEEYPKYLHNFRTGQEDKTIHPDVIELVKNQDVLDVLNGKDIQAELDEDALKRFLRLKATAKAF
jgi:chromosomal replication initiation ATPase DnaA